MHPSSYRLSRYLKAKQTVDARALNRRVEERFYAELGELASAQNGAVSIVDLGAGLGPTAKRLVKARGTGPFTSITYHLVDQSAELLREARTRLRDWMREEGFNVQEATGQIHCSRGDRSFLFRFHPREATQFLRTHSEEQFSSVIAQSFIDLVNIQETLRLIAAAARKQGILYFPLTFDGTTRFLPAGSSSLSHKIIQYYHESMDRETENGTAGGGQAGVQLLEDIPKVGSFLAAGSSDWLVYPREDIGYEEDEAYFLHHILHFVERELMSDPRLSTDLLSEWIADRRDCVLTERLIFQASQVDVLARVGTSYHS